MELNEYQKKAMETCTASSENFTYMMLNLVGEVGELASKVAKQVRKDNLCVMNNRLKDLMPADSELADKINIEMQLEAGDILWQLAGLCHVNGWSLERIAQMNVEKLANRQKDNTIIGDGDYR